MVRVTMQDDGGVETILVVDDNPADVRFIEEAFQESALDPPIHTTSTRDEAIEFLHDDGSPNPALVLLDWNLSRATGEEVLEAARSGDCHIPVIVMTGSSTATSTLGSTIEGTDLVFEKPTEPDGYINAVRSVLPNL